MDRLQLVRISQASADQRAGRAGRTRPGVCLRLWPERTHPPTPARRAGDPPPRPGRPRAPIAGLGRDGCQRLSRGSSRRRPPRWSRPKRCCGGWTPSTPREMRPQLGRAMARLPVSPRLGRMLLEGRRLGQPEAVALAAALLSDRDPFSRRRKARLPRRACGRGLVGVGCVGPRGGVGAVRAVGPARHAVGRINRAAARLVLHVRDQLLRELRPTAARRRPGETAADEAVLRGLLAAFPDRLVRRSQPGQRLRADGRRPRACGWPTPARSAMPPCFSRWTSTAERRKPWSGRPRRSSARWLPAEHLSHRAPRWNSIRDAQRVIARRRVSGKTCCWRNRPTALPDDAKVARILAAAAAEALDEVFPWDDPATADYVSRVALSGPMDAGTGVARVGRPGAAGGAAGGLLRAAGRSTSCARPRGWRRSRVFSRPSSGGRSSAKPPSGSRCPAAAASSCITSRASRRCWPCGSRKFSACWKHHALPGGAWRCCLHSAGPQHASAADDRRLGQFLADHLSQVRRAPAAAIPSTPGRRILIGNCQRRPRRR